MVDPARALWWAQAERERAAVVALAADLAPVGVRVLVFKGIYLTFAVAPEPDYRLSLDADLLVVEGSFERAAARIRALARWSLDDRNLSAHAVRLPETGAYIDLHRRALPPRFGRFDAAATRARARAMPDEFGPHVLLPDPLDAAALTVANYTKDMLGAVGHGNVARDLELLERHAGVEPRTLADRLRSHGLRRVALLAFVDLAAHDPRWAPYRDALSPSRPERAAMDAMARAMRPLAARSDRLAFLAVRALADRPTDGVLSVLLTGARFARDRLREGPGGGL